MGWDGREGWDGMDDVTAVRKPTDICNLYVPQIDAGRPGTGEDKKKNGRTF